MSGAHEQNRKRRPFRFFVIVADVQVDDDLEGVVLLKRGFLCIEQDQGRTKRDALWVKVLDNGLMVKLEKKYLYEVAADLVGLVEPVQDLETNRTTCDSWFLSPSTRRCGSSQASRMSYLRQNSSTSGRSALGATLFISE